MLLRLEFSPKTRTFFGIRTLSLKCNPQLDQTFSATRPISLDENLHLELLHATTCSFQIQCDCTGNPVSKTKPKKKSFGHWATCSTKPQPPSKTHMLPCWQMMAPTIPQLVTSYHHLWQSPTKKKHGGLCFYFNVAGDLCGMQSCIIPATRLG